MSVETQLVKYVAGHAVIRPNHTCFSQIEVQPIRSVREIGVRNLVVGGEPGGGIPAIRARVQDAWGQSCAS